MADDYLDIKSSNFMSWMITSPLNNGKKLIGVIKKELSQGKYQISFKLSNIFLYLKIL